MGKADIVAAVIFGIATLQGVLLVASLLIASKFRTKAHWFLIALIMCITLVLFQNFVILSGFYLKFPHAILAFYPLNGLIGPVFFLYVLFLLYPERRIKWYDGLHLIPFVLMFIGHWPFIMMNAADKIGAAEYLYYSQVDFLPFIIPDLVIRKLIILVYGIAALSFSNKKIRTLSQLSSNTSVLFLGKFRNIILLFILYAASSFCLQVYSLIIEVYVGNYEIYHHMITSIVILLLTMISMNQPEVLTFLIEEKRSIKESVKSMSGQMIIEELRRVMKETKPYLHADLKLYDLANLTHFSPKEISNSINNELNLNFFEFINSYRVEEFKVRLTSDKYSHYTLLGIAFEVGFNSKASMNRVFKKHTGMTPSDFLKRNQVSTYKVETKTI